jgi:ribosomal protein S16
MNPEHFKILFCLFISVLITGCAAEYISDGRDVCFDQEVYPIIISTCTQSECHNPVDLVEHLDLTTYDGILGLVHPGNYNKSKLYDVITSPFSPMPPPPYSRLTKDQITTISLWIEKGANTTDSCVAEVCDTSFVGFNATIKPIMEVFCNGCHGGSNPQGGINYNNFDGIKSTVNDGRFLGSIQRAVGYVPMPKNGNKLTDCKINQIEKWIREGAKNN